MTNEEKLLKLLEVAVENGWENEKDFISNLHSITDNFIFVDDVDFVRTLHSLNDLVTNFESNEVSFIEALCNKNMNKKMNISNLYFYNSELSLVEIVRLEWNLKPTSERLTFLFKTFNHLL